MRLDGAMAAGAGAGSGGAGSLSAVADAIAAGTAQVDDSQNARYEDIHVEPNALFALLKLGEEKRSECLAEQQVKATT